MRSPRVVHPTLVSITICLYWPFPRVGSSAQEASSGVNRLLTTCLFATQVSSFRVSTSSSMGAPGGMRPFLES
ncbi:hypothetical protein FA13DRAFT_1724532 [Coprinellus micaceus]|uniref:Uncharacterized protein n=1 Tax=Coprinellus micaceus TaxID=71717 RepID=A0A4Y7TX86_COPMI|nr:hypothetical protein FA13DRAFT_1724532 [Coprinellus micaceus]